MQRLSILVGTAAAALVIGGPARAQLANQTVGFSVRPISQIAIQGSPTVIIQATTAGATTIVSTVSASYAITTNEDNRQVLASVDSPLPAGVTLTMNMAAPTGATSCEVTLGTSPRTAVTGVSRLRASGLAIDYTITVAPAAAVQTSVRTVTLTIGTGA